MPLAHITYIDRDDWLRDEERDFLASSRERDRRSDIQIALAECERLEAEAAEIAEIQALRREQLSTIEAIAAIRASLVSPDA